MTERGKNGRFLPGNKEGKGRPRKVYAEAFSRVVSPDDFEKIIETANKQAKDGHHDARVWLADRLAGKVPQILELQAHDAALLKELLQVCDERNIPASEVFQAMLASIAEQVQVETGSNDTDAG